MSTINPNPGCPVFLGGRGRDYAGRPPLVEYGAVIKTKFAETESGSVRVRDYERDAGDYSGGGQSPES